MKSDCFSRLSILLVLMTLFQSLQIARADDEDKCPICRECIDASRKTQLACLHTFHRNCIDEVTKKFGASCPMCRQVDPKLSEKFERIQQQLFPALQYEQLRQFTVSPSDLSRVQIYDSPLVQQQVNQEALARTYDRLSRQKKRLQLQQGIFQSAELFPKK